MKLNGAQLRKVEAQLGVEAIAEEHPAIPKLKEVFGDHSFFLDAAGLNVIEPDPSPDNENGNVVKVASWADENRTGLQMHDPQVLSVAVDLATETTSGQDSSS